MKFKQFRNGFIISLSLLALLYGFAPYALAYGKEFFSATDVDPKTIIKLQKERGVRLLGKPNLDLEPVIESPSILKIISSSNSLWFVVRLRYNSRCRYRHSVDEERSTINRHGSGPF